MKRIAVLGSTGSIGTSCLDVVAAHPDQVSALGMTAHSRWKQLAEQSQQFAPQFVVVADETLRNSVDRSQFPRQTEIDFGPEAVARLAAHPDVDVVVSGIVGAAGLNSSLAALQAGKTVALANKETLVVAGPLVLEAARKNGSRLIPVDSEHSAVFQALQCGQDREVRRVILTASGGPFRTRSAEELVNVTPAMALDHPTWDMGPKITIDSATMMNKALEIIEARWLFDLPADKIDVVVHPQSIVHSMVEFVDGSVIAQLSPPDMKLPIQYALTYPERIDGISPQLDLSTAFNLEFFPPDYDRFPALKLGFEVARRGGTSGAVLNGGQRGRRGTVSRRRPVVPRNPPGLPRSSLCTSL